MGSLRHPGYQFGEGPQRLQRRGGPRSLIRKERELVNDSPQCVNLSHREHPLGGVQIPLDLVNELSGHLVVRYLHHVRTVAAGRHNPEPA